MEAEMKRVGFVIYDDDGDVFYSSLKIKPKAMGFITVKEALKKMMTIKHLYVEVRDES